MKAFVKRRAIGMLRGTDRIIELFENLSVLGAIVLVAVCLIAAMGRIDPIDFGWMAADTFTLTNLD